MRRALHLQRPAAAKRGARGLQLQLDQSSTTRVPRRSIVMGCGSNVVDEFYPLRRFPKVRFWTGPLDRSVRRID